MLSRDFYYFGLAAKEIPHSLRSVVKRNQGHRVIENQNFIAEFDRWIRHFQQNKIYADPQLRWKFDKTIGDKIVTDYPKKNSEDDDDEIERVC